MSEHGPPNIEVFHDGDCPICRFEIAFYGKIDRQNRIRWTDIIEQKDEALPVGKTRATLLGKFHVRELPIQENPVWFTGVDAFQRIWRELIVFKWFAWIFSVPGLRQLAELAYRGFLGWQSRHRQKRQR